MPDVRLPIRQLRRFHRRPADHHDHTAAGAAPPEPLAGDVRVRALPGHEAVLTELAISAERQGYLAERRGALTLSATNLR